MLRRAGGDDVSLGKRSNGTVLGEMSLLTGEPRRRPCAPSTARSSTRSAGVSCSRAGRAPGAGRRAAGARWRRGCGPRQSLERYDARAAGSRPAEVREELQGVDARGVRAEALDVVAPGRELLRLRERDAVLGREDDRGGERGERQVGGGEASPVRYAPVGQERGDRVELGQHRRGRRRGPRSRGGAGPSGPRAGRARERLRLPAPGRPGCCRSISSGRGSMCA